MKRIMLEDVIAHYEGGYEEIQAILDDAQRSTREKLAAIADVVESESEDDEEGEAA